MLESFRNHIVSFDLFLELSNAFSDRAGEVLELANCHVNMKFALVVIYPHDFQKKRTIMFLLFDYLLYSTREKISGQPKPNRISSMALTKALYYQVSL